MPDRPFETPYGYLDEDRREYVITDPRTPRPWFNYMWNERYTGLVSHTGGGFSYLDSPRDNRLTRMRYNSLPWDRPGRTVMLRDRRDGDFWSLSWAPTLEQTYDDLEIRHGLGYTRIRSRRRGVKAELCYFVPRDLPGEVWRIDLANEGSTPVELDLFAFAEPLMGNALNDLINQPNDKHFPSVRFNAATNSLEATRRYWVLNRGVSVAQPNLSWPFTLHFSATQTIEAFDGSLDSFIGRWRSEAKPLRIEEGRLGNSEIDAGEAVLALQLPLSLTPGESCSVAVIMALEQSEESPVDFDPLPRWSLAEWQDMERIDEAFEDLRHVWRERLAGYQVDSPDKAFNAMASTWNAYQTAVTFDMARNAGFYHGGLLFGTGMRDQFQDILGMLLQEPERVRARLLKALTFQFSDGSTLHNFFKLTGQGERTHHSDTPLWIPFGITAYLKETGDLGLLDEKVVFHDEGQATVREHLLRALRYALSNLGPNGLPLIRNGDWNDTLDKVGPAGKGETVWGAAFLGYVLQQSIELFQFLGEAALVEEFTTAYEHLSTRVNERCWDGEWYLRAFRDDGRPLGTRQEQQGRLFLNAQSWAVISGFADEQRGQQALSVCLDHLRTPYGMQLCWPAFREADASVGLASRCVPGKKENAAVFNHASAWYVLAALKAGLIEEAWSIYRDMLPLNSSRDADRYEIEPYVFAEYVTSPEHELAGQASHSWLTGSAVWMHHIGAHYILGIQPHYDGLYFDPRIPADWDQVNVVRRFRGRRLTIHIDNTAGVNRGVAALRVNGHEQTKPVLAIEDTADGAELEITVVMGT